MVILISLRTLTNKNPLSLQSIVICLISSSKHCEYSSSLIGQIPVSIACFDVKLASKSRLKFVTSTLVAGVGEMYLNNDELAIYIKIIYFIKSS